MQINNYIKTKIQNWLDMNSIPDIIDYKIKSNNNTLISIYEARITALELAQAIMESHLYNNLKSKNITTKKKEQKNKPTKKPKVNAFKVSKKDFKEAFGKGFSKIKTNKKRGRPTKSI